MPTTATARHDRAREPRQAHVRGGRARAAARVPLRDRASARRAPRVPGERSGPDPARPRSIRSRASATSSTSRRSPPATPCSTSAAAPAPTASWRRSPAGRVVGVDMTAAQLAKARGLAADAGFANVEFREGYIERPPVDDGSFDCVISNGVVNLSPDKPAVFAAAARALRPGGRLALADIVSAQQLPEGVTCDASLWAACIGGAMQRDDYREAIEAAGFTIETWRENTEYRFVSDRADNATQKYGVTSISLLARRSRPSPAHMSDGVTSSVEASGTSASGAAEGSRSGCSSPEPCAWDSQRCGRVACAPLARLFEQYAEARRAARLPHLLHAQARRQLVANARLAGATPLGSGSATSRAQLLRPWRARGAVRRAATRRPADRRRATTRRGVR